MDNVKNDQPETLNESQNELSEIKKFIRSQATLDDLNELEDLIADRRRFFVDFTCGNPNKKD